VAEFGNLRTALKDQSDPHEEIITSFVLSCLERGYHAVHKSCLSGCCTQTCWRVCI